MAAALTGDHQGHGVSLIVVTHDNLTVVSARVVGTETGDLHGSIEGIGSVSWQHDASTESLIHLDYITFGREKIGFFMTNVCWHPAGLTDQNITFMGAQISGWRYICITNFYLFG